ncbi:MAG: hypothetical protein QOF33_5113, partial [Thermomicrobiales bacterium]|nr:hypothetical protein [Thermomicrobiales bacterium]
MPAQQAPELDQREQRSPGGPRPA